MPLFVVSYDYTPASDAQLAVRPAHREFLRGLPALVASGPTDDNGAFLIFDAGSADEALGLLDADPYRAGGFIADRRVTGWTPVLGRWVDSGRIP